MNATRTQTQKIIVVKNVSDTFGVKLTHNRGNLLLVEGGRNPVSVRESELSAATAGKQVSEVDAKGGVLLPGYNNCHYHTLYALLEFFKPIYSIFGKTSKQEVLDALRADVPSVKEMGKGLILAYGLNTVKVQDLTREDLDAIERDVPMIVFDPSYHGAVVNTAALRLIDQKARIREQEGLQVSGECRANGQLTADYVFLGFTLMDDIFGSNVYDAAQKEADVIYAWMKEQVKIGITRMHEMFVVTPAHAFAIILAAVKWEQEMGIAFPIEKMYVKPEVLKSIFTNPEYREISTHINLQIGNGNIGIKLLADGSFGSYTALLSDPYLDLPTSGSIVDSESKCDSAILLARMLGITDIRMHAIGDAGIKFALRVMESARSQLGPRASLGIEHFELSGSPGILSRTADLGVRVCSQPNFEEDVINYAGRLGGRVSRINPHRLILVKGIPLITGDDGMPASALGTIHNFTHHPVASQRLHLEEAVAIASRTHELTRTSDVVDGLMIVTPEAFSRLSSRGKTEEQIRAEMSNIWGASVEFNRAVTHVMISGQVM